MYLPHTDENRQAMLHRIGVSSLDELYADVPTQLASPHIELPAAMDEAGVRRYMEACAGQNTPASQLRCFLGGGAYQHHIPAVVSSLISRGEFSTTYTPYQPEASQGTLVAIYEFQTMIAELYGMELANASLYDGASALAEAVIVAVRQGRKRGRILVSRAVHPHYRATLRCYLERQDVELVDIPLHNGLTDRDALRKACDKENACVVFQHPNVFGHLEPAAELCEAAHDCGALAVTAGHPLAFGALQPPGEFGADLACGEGQPLGLPLAYGGPYVGLLAAGKSLVRKLPGRLVGKTVDSHGEPGYILTLQTREQHIRREKATSNICTNQGLCALAATIYLALLGPQGLHEVSANNLRNTDRLKQRLQQSRAFADKRIALPWEHPSFNEFVLQVQGDPDAVLASMRKQHVLGGFALRRWYPELDRHLLVCSTELHTADDHEAYVEALEAAL